jgi:hypothetical protein
MSFSPNLFLSNVRGKDGLARPSRFEVILPIPTYINSFVGNSVIEKILNFPNSVFNDVSDAIGSAFGRSGNDDAQSRSANSSMSRYLALQCENAELPGKTLQTADVKIYGPTFKVPYQTQYGDTNLTFLCTNQFYERKLFDRWMEAIMPSDTNNLRFPKGQTTRYMTNIKIIQYDDFIKQIYVGKDNATSPQYYVRLGKFLELVQDNLIPIVNDDPNQKLIKIDTDIDTNLGEYLQKWINYAKQKNII